MGSPIPLHRYRRFKKTKTEQRADRIEVLAKQLALPGEALADASVVFSISEETSVPEIPFIDALLAQTSRKADGLAFARHFLRPSPKGDAHAE